MTTVSAARAAVLESVATTARAARDHIDAVAKPLDQGNASAEAVLTRLTGDAADATALLNALRRSVETHGVAGADDAAAAVTKLIDRGVARASDTEVAVAGLTSMWVESGNVPRHALIEVRNGFERVADATDAIGAGIEAQRLAAERAALDQVVEEAAEAIEQARPVNVHVHELEEGSEQRLIALLQQRPGSGSIEAIAETPVEQRVELLGELLDSARSNRLAGADEARFRIGFGRRFLGWANAEQGLTRAHDSLRATIDAANLVQHIDHLTLRANVASARAEAISAYGATIDAEAHLLPWRGNRPTFVDMAPTTDIDRARARVTMVLELHRTRAAVDAATQIHTDLAGTDDSWRAAGGAA